MINNRNSISNRKLKTLTLSELENPAYKDLVGRKKEIESVMDAYGKLAMGNSEKLCVCIRGEPGSGKTILLTYLKNKLLSQNANVYWVFRHENDVIITILQQIIAGFDKDDKDADYINSYILPISKGMSNNKLDYDRSTLVKFTYDRIKEKTVVFIIDDMDMVDDFSLDAFEKLISINKKLFLVFSCGDDSDNTLFTEFLSRMHNDGALINISLPAFSSAEGIERTISEQIENLDDNDHKILEALAIYNSIPVSAAEIKPLLEAETKDISSRLESLVQMRMLFVEVINNELYFSFPNNTLKNHINKKKSDSNSLEAHQVAADTLMKREPLSVRVMDQIIYHLEKAGDKTRLLGYLIKNAKEYAKLSDYVKAAKNYNRALELCGRRGYVDTKLDILLALGDVYTDYEKYDTAVEFLSQAAETSRVNKRSEKRLLAVIGLEFCYCKKKDKYNANKYLNIVEALFTEPDKMTDDIELYLKHQCSKQEILYLDGCNETYHKAVLYGLSVCSGHKDPKRKCYYQSQFYVNLAQYYLYNGRLTETVQTGQKALELAEKADDIVWHWKAMLNLGTYYFYSSELESAKRIREKLLANCRVSNIVSNVRYNYVTTYFSPLLEFNPAIEYMRELLNISIVTDDFKLKYSSYTSLIDFYMETNNYINANNYMKLCHKGIKNHDMLYAYMLYASVKFFFRIGDFSQMSKYLEIFKEFADGNKVYDKYLTPLTERNKWVEIISMRKNNTKASELEAHVKKTYETTIKSVTSRASGLYVIYQFFVLLRLNDCLQYVDSEIDGWVAKASEHPNASVLFHLYAQYVKSFKAIGEDKLDMLLDMYKTAARQTKGVLLAYICEDLGDYYADKNSFWALDYLSRACDTVRNLLMNVPEEYRLMFIEHHKLFSAFEKLHKVCGVNVTGDILDVVFDKDLLLLLLDDESIMKSFRASYLSMLPRGMRNRRGIEDHLKADPKSNLKLLAQYFASKACAGEAHIVIDEPNGSFISLASTCTYPMHNCEYIMNRAKSLKRAIIATEDYNNINDSANQLLNGAKAVMCVPVIIKGQVTGYVYLRSDSMFHNINDLLLSKIRYFYKSIYDNI